MSHVPANALHKSPGPGYIFCSSVGGPGHCFCFFFLSSEICTPGSFPTYSTNVLPEIKHLRIVLFCQNSYWQNFKLG